MMSFLLILIIIISCLSIKEGEEIIMKTELSEDKLIELITAFYKENEDDEKLLNYGLNRENINFESNLRWDDNGYWILGDCIIESAENDMYKIFISKNYGDHKALLTILFEIDSQVYRIVSWNIQELYI